MRYSYAVVVILYNPDEFVIKRIETYCKFFSCVWVVDNSEIPVYASKLKSNKKIIYQSQGRNTGITGALNYAFFEAKKRDIDYLLTMDQDTEYEADQIENMIKAIETYPKGINGIYCCNYRKMYQKVNGQGIEYDKWRIGINEKIIVTNAMTSGSFYDVSIVYTFLPLNNLFIGYVDDDIAYAMKKRGYNILMVGNSCMSQQVGKRVKGTSINKLFHKVILSSQRYYYMGRNSRYLLEKYKDDPNISRSIRKSRTRNIINLLFCEENKLIKLREWNRGNKEFQKIVDK